MMSFLVIPFSLLGALVVLAVWGLSRYPRFKLDPPQAVNQLNLNATKPTTGITLTVVAAGVLGLFLRLYGIDRSLWLDEFGTLWTIEGSFSQVVERAFLFHGQSPFYYSIMWAFVQIFGISEITLRLPSLVFGLVSGYVTYLLAKNNYGERVGVIAAALLWLSPAMGQTDTNARPYALALLMTVIMFYGFFRTTQLADRRGRCLFVIGGVGLFTTHYLLTLIALGIALAYLYIPLLRARYSPRQFISDIGLQLLLVVWGLPQLYDLWSRRAALSWLGDYNYFAFFEVIGPFIVAGLMALSSHRLTQPSSSQQATTWGFCLALLTPIACLAVLAYFGVNLLERRYMMPILIPAAVIGALAFASAAKISATLMIAYWVLFTSVAFAMNFRAYGTFSTVGAQDWRQAATCVDKLWRAENKPVVLYRSGFVEEDILTGGQPPPGITRSPIQNFRLPKNPWQLIPLTYTWSAKGREDYFVRYVEPVLGKSEIFYFLTCRNCFNQSTGKYPELLLDWIEKKFPARFVAQPIDAGHGITLIRFAGRNHKDRLDSLLARRLPTASTQSTPSRLEPQYSC